MFTQTHKKAGVGPLLKKVLFSPDSKLSRERVVGMGSRTEQRQGLDGRTVGPRQDVAQLQRVVLDALLREEVVEGLRNVAHGFRESPHEARQFPVDGRRRVDRVQALRKEDGEGGRDVPRRPDVVLPLLLRLLQPDVLFQELHRV